MPKVHQIDKPPIHHAIALSPLPELEQEENCLPERKKYKNSSNNRKNVSYASHIWKVPAQGATRDFTLSDIL